MFTSRYLAHVKFRYSPEANTLSNSSKLRIADELGAKSGFSSSVKITPAMLLRHRAVRQNRFDRPAVV
jgi:hypothetical protein